MKKSNSVIGFVVLIGIALLLLALKRPVSTTEGQVEVDSKPFASSRTDFGQPHIGALNGSLPILQDFSVIDFGRTVCRDCQKE